MNVRLRLASLLPCAVLLSGGCVIVGDDDNDPATTVAATGGQTTSDTSGQTTSDTSGQTTSGTSGQTASGTTGADLGSSGIVESGSSGAAIDCAQCEADVQPDPLCHSEYDAENDVCVCDAGYTFESSDPAGDSNFECEPVERPPTDECGSDPNITVGEDGGCVCVEGWMFCTTDPDDYSCCEV